MKDVVIVGALRTAIGCFQGVMLVERSCFVGVWPEQASGQRAFSLPGRVVAGDA